MEPLVYWILFSPLAVQVIFVILKLVGFIGWSWWLVFLPVPVFVAFLVLFAVVLNAMWSH